MRDIKFQFIWQKKTTVVKHVLTLDEICRSVATPLMRGKEMPLIAKRQFTGLTDKKDVEAYEGDIALGFAGELLAVISWSDEDCAFTMDMTSGGGAMINQQYMNNFEIIGNIHQNAELLTC